MKERDKRAVARTGDDSTFVRKKKMLGLREYTQVKSQSVQLKVHTIDKNFIF